MVRVWQSTGVRKGATSCRPTRRERGEHGLNEREQTNGLKQWEAQEAEHAQTCRPQGTVCPGSAHEGPPDPPGVQGGPRPVWNPSTFLLFNCISHAFSACQYLSSLGLLPSMTVPQMFWVNIPALKWTVFLHMNKHLFLIIHYQDSQRLRFPATPFLPPNRRWHCP